MVLSQSYLDAAIKEELLTHDEIRAQIAAMLSAPLDADDSDFVESAFGLIGRVGPPDNWLDTISKLVLETTHTQHEEIISDLQYYRSPNSVSVLRGAIALKPKLSYLEYDDYGAYYKKCLWALQAIGTAEALSVISECINSPDAALSEQAQYRLSKIKACQ